MSVRDDLIAAKAQIDSPEKWCKGIEPGQNCTMWAVQAVCGKGGMRWNAVDAALRNALPRRKYDNPDGRHRVVAFNDDLATTHADILALFDRAIAAQPVQP